MTLPVRVASVRLLDDVSRGGSLNTLYRPIEACVQDSDRAFLKELVYGSLRLWPFYKGIVRQLLDQPLKSKDSALEATLIMAMYELDECHTPDYASVSAAVDVCNAIDKPWASRLINGCLRRYQRDRSTLHEALGDTERAALPGWLYKSLIRSLPDAMSSIADVSKKKPPLTLRVNVQKGSRDDYKEQLQLAGIPTRALGSSGLTLLEPLPVAQIPKFEAGFVSVQDHSAQLAAELITFAPGARILDACAAPGGKACHLAELGAQVTAMDISEARLKKVSDNAARLRLSIATVACNATDIPHGLIEEAFDGILLDAPCSATGVMRRNPDVKVIRTKADIAQFAALQLNLITSVWPHLKTGGQLLYATCSLLPDENEDVVGTFLSTTSDAQSAPLPKDIGVQMTYGQQVIPSADNGDGLYYCLLKKVG
ncbi:MAG: 16S rRNA (cytosine(967)-C(5))-methyltransferase RsmB [Luminiphilus sp.]|nr:16S rRNA (cytosine(967)-C(5))-methyltransferase RsmB [Luminiphilus sp.]